MSYFVDLLAYMHIHCYCKLILDWSDAMIFYLPDGFCTTVNAVYTFLLIDFYHNLWLLIDWDIQKLVVSACRIASASGELNIATLVKEQDYFVDVL